MDGALLHEPYPKALFVFKDLCALLIQIDLQVEQLKGFGSAKNVAVEIVITC